MVREPPESTFKSPDQSHQRHPDRTNKTHQESTDEAISGNFAEKLPDLRLQIRPSSHQFHGNLTTRFTHLVKRYISLQSQDKLTVQSPATRIPVSKQSESRKVTTALLGAIILWMRRTEAEQHGTYSQDHAGPNGKKQDQLLMEKQKINMRSKHGDTQMSPNQNDQHDNAGDTTLDVIEVESSSHFSFGVKPTDTLTSNEGQQRLGKTNNYTNEINYDQMQEQQARTTNSQSKKSGEDDTQAGKASQANSSRDAVSLSSSENHLNANAKGQKNVMLNDQELVNKDNKEGRTSKSRQGNKRSNNNKTPKRGAVSSNLNNKRKKNGNCQEEETIDQRKKKHRRQYGDQPHHRTKCQRSNHKSQLIKQEKQMEDSQEHNSNEGTTTQGA
ncbi:hypothetical protein KY290_027473 [Solanum tuberosum]|uniref:Uncharacterized protein n=1 Tax=Solanum tuberosum TaxID=4113 RepID=A0ABQ7UF29_SOLTU|nr:hypothetical protein KY290_027473 [Solanum tuberosum]